jgi:GTP cyclohydrolase IA
MIDRTRAALAIDEFLRALGRDPAVHAEHRETGKFVADAFIDEFCAGYAVNVPSLIQRDMIAIHGSASLIVIRDIPTRTACPHHLMVASGFTTLAMMPKRRIVGLGVYVQVVEAFAHRLTLQEDIAREVVDALYEQLEPEYLGCTISLSHGCLSQRGERAHGATVETCATRGIDSEPFLQLVRRHR